MIYLNLQVGFIISAKLRWVKSIMWSFQERRFVCFAMTACYRCWSPKGNKCLEVSQKGFLFKEEKKERVELWTRTFKSSASNVCTLKDQQLVAWMVTAMKNFLKFKTGESPDVRKFGEEYYLREAKIWRPFRIGGVFSIAIALPLALASILHDNWLYGDGKCLLLFRVKSFNNNLPCLTHSFLFFN